MMRLYRDDNHHQEPTAKGEKEEMRAQHITHFLTVPQRKETKRRRRRFLSDAENLKRNVLEPLTMVHTTKKFILCSTYDVIAL